jgi:hypothetical protein
MKKNDNGILLYDKLVAGTYDNTQFRSWTAQEQSDTIAALLFAMENAGN